MFYQPARQQFDQSYSPFSGGLGQFGYSTFGSPFGFGGGGGGNFGGFGGFGGGYSPFGFGGGYSPFGFGGGYGGFNPMMGGLGQFGYSPFGFGGGFGGGFGNFNPFFSGIGGLGQFGQQQNMQPINPGNTNFNALKQDFRNMPTEAYMFDSSPLRATPLREPGSLTMDAATNPLDDSRMGVENARSARENWFRKSPEQQQRLLNQSQQLQTLGVNSPQMQAFLG